MVMIRPEVAMYAAFARLNYRPWYALAEFVDNSLQSGLANYRELARLHGGDYRVVVEIDVSEDCIEIRDNAAGIAEPDYDRAFLPACPPPDTSGLSEFGLGMKAAASWFGRKWSVRTSAIEEAQESTITFDIPLIVDTHCESLQPTVRSVEPNAHYTTIKIYDLNVRPRGRTIGKIKEHLSSIYRLFLRDGILELRFNGEPLSYELPTLLEVPFYATPEQPPVVWRKDINLDLGDGHRITGWAGLLARASVANAGFAVFRRRRLILGSPGEGYRPESIFGPSNKFIYQRLIGELAVEGFSVSHTKDGLQWDDWEEDILHWLKIELDSSPLPLLQQADNYRARATVAKDVLIEAARDTSASIAQHLPPLITDQLSRQPSQAPPPPMLECPATGQARREEVSLALEHAHRTWRVAIELVNDGTREDWYEVAERLESGGETRVHIRVNLGHPFMVRFVSPQGDEVVPFTRLAAALAISELTAREIGVRQAGTIRMNLNQILRGALSGPIQGGEIHIAE